MSNGSRPGLNKMGIVNASLEKSVGFDLGTSGCEEKSRCFCLQYLWASYLPQSTRAR
ncbi:hypothetical protein Gohar_022102 [Gossypium harknessii]|uniref:Uncharacterized protein n=1 Tax=Gossypium harknessii TaxID=34285 RepID=A0A7J9ID55_9ROSI|nr:hypothetical protein [Gossypium harknessii]